MKDTDPTSEMLLAALRDAEPSAGTERRILAAMEAREAEASAPFWRQLRPLPLASAVAIAGVLIIALHQHWSAPPDTRRHATVPAVRRTIQPEVVTQQVPIAPRRPAARGSLRREGSPVPETRVASFPAPPMPLTAQEKLLLRLAHRHNPEDTAILNPAVQAAQSAKATEQFQQFFGLNPTEMRSQLE
jgi:hypothetical protein